VTVGVMPARKAKALVGSEKPRLAPPVPARSLVGDFIATAKELGIELFPWQKQAARYMTALGRGERWLYPEVAIVVARQNGKTRLLVPLVVSRLRAGHKITHAAQTRELTRDLFGEIADIMAQDPSLFPKRRGRPIMPRFGAGQEEIRLANGGSYRIVAGNRSGARGQTNDLVLIDELREFKDFDFIGSAKPTLNASAHPQMIYLSNAGEDDSLVLNSTRLRADSDPNLAYLEWSAAPDQAATDIEAWLSANPAIGHIPSLMETLEREYQTNRMQGTLGIFETEYLCRSVISTRQKLVEDFAWASCAGPLEAPSRPVLAFSMDPDGRRASAAIAWRRPDGSVGLRLTYNVTGNPIDTDRLGADLRRNAARMGIRTVGFDPLTDAALAKFFKKPESISGGKFANATAQFCNLVTAGKLRWADCEAVTDDLTWTARKVDTESGSYEAVRVKDDRPITASLAAVRAVWLASVPSVPSPKVM
jgi:hypothetical protein